MCRPGPPKGIEVMNEFSDGNRADELFRLAVESSPSAMVMVDFEGKIVLVNAQTVKLFGYARQELIGQTIEMLVPEVPRKSHPPIAARSRAPASRPMELGGDVRSIRTVNTFLSRSA